METYYRITYEEDGIYNAIKNEINNYEIWNHILDLDEIKWLPKPPIYKFNNQSYFTEEGYKIFNDKVLPIIYNYLEKDKIKVDTYSNLDNIVYSDIYQVVIKID